MTSSKKHGFSLLELLVTISIGLIMAGVTFVALMPLFKQNNVDTAYDTTISVIRNYRNHLSVRVDATSLLSQLPELLRFSIGASPCPYHRPQ